MDDSSRCPICSVAVIKQNIEIHVNDCLNRSSNVEKSPLKKIKLAKKESWSFLKNINCQQNKNSNKIYESKCSNVYSLREPNLLKSVPEDEPIVKTTTSVEEHFDKNQDGIVKVPLAESMRPLSLDDLVGHDDVFGAGKTFRNLIENHNFFSIILWGPPGCGKTTVARIISHSCESDKKHWRFAQLSATVSGLADVRSAIEVAKNEWKLLKRRTVLFVDEIHRFNKLQQDSFLSHIEDGSIIFIGATTENPSFQVNNALLSRCKVIVLLKLSIESVEFILRKALMKCNIQVVSSPLEVNNARCITEGGLKLLSGMCDGDARAALNTLQCAIDSQYQSTTFPNLSTECFIDVPLISQIMTKPMQYDRKGDEHYNIVSALIKSIRGSDANAAIYWLARMIEGGEDALFIARRLVISASEDIGLADDRALPLAVATFQACHLIGLPECAINLAHCTTYLARASKSNASYAALEEARSLIKSFKGPHPSVPLHLRNAPTKLMRDLGYHKGYIYNHDAQEPVNQTYLPDTLLHVNFFKN